MSLSAVAVGRRPVVSPAKFVNGYKWELYNLTEDYLENNNLAGKMSHKLHEMQELFLVEATKYNVFPLDNSVLPRLEWKSKISYINLTMGSGQ